METASKDITNVVRSVKLLKIDSYCTTNEDCIKSSCSIGGYDWEICIYPERLLLASDGTPWVAVKLVFLSENCPSIVRANLSCRLVDPRGERQPSEAKSVSCIFNRPCILRCLEMCLPFVKEGCSLPVVLMSKGKLATSGFLRNGSFTVECIITVHKPILAARSPVLMAEFFGHMKEASCKRVEIKDMRAEVFEL